MTLRTVASGAQQAPYRNSPRPETRRRGWPRRFWRRNGHRGAILATVAAVASAALPVTRGPPVQIQFRKLSDERHALAIVRPAGARDEVDCETRSTLVHDLLHFAVESEAGIATGFWGRLAGGLTLADMNDRTGAPLGAGAADKVAIEQIVGALSGAAKGRSAAEMVAGMRRFAAALGATMPDWLTESFIEAVQERMRRLLGHWRATPYGATMTLDWRTPPAARAMTMIGWKTE